jgi:hypothetical protein
MKKGRSLALGLLLVLLLLVAYRAFSGAGRGNPIALLAPPRVTSIPNAEVDIPAGAFYGWRYAVEPSQPTCHLTGHVEVLSGGNKDVIVYVLESDDYENLKNGHDAKIYFQTARTSAATLDVHTTAPGPKVLAISNAFSVLTSKRIRLDNSQVVCQ